MTQCIVIAASLTIGNETHRKGAIIELDAKLLDSPIYARSVEVIGDIPEEVELVVNPAKPKK